MLFARATGGQFEDSFRMDVLTVFNVFNKMLTHSNEVILPTQVNYLGFFVQNTMNLSATIVDLLFFADCSAAQHKCCF